MLGAFSAEDNWLGCEADHLPPSGVEVIYLHGMYREKFTFYAKFRKKKKIFQTFFAGQMT
jgi:hypothetical protein